MSRKFKTPTEVEAEIKALKEIKPKVRRFSAFNDDHHKSIDIQIAVLEEGLDEDDINERYDDSDENSQAYEAFQWREGTSDEESLVDGWKSLAK